MIVEIEETPISPEEIEFAKSIITKLVKPTKYQVYVWEPAIGLVDEVGFAIDLQTSHDILADLIARYWSDKDYTTEFNKFMAEEKGLVHFPPIP